MTNDYFDISLLVWLAGERTQALFQEHLPSLQSGRSLTHDEGFFNREKQQLRFSIRYVTSKEELMAEINRLLSQSLAARLIIICDRFIEVDASGGFGTTKLASDIRASFNSQSTHLLGLMGIVDAEAHHSRDVDCVISLNAAQAVVLPGIVRVANALWLKSPPPRPPPDQVPEAIEVRLARSMNEIRACLDLRFRVYDALGYLEERISNNPSRIELDAYDRHALHFCAMVHGGTKIAGTARVVCPAQRHRLDPSRSGVPRELSAGHLRNLGEVVDLQQVWIRELSEEHTALRRRIREDNPAVPLPIMDNTDFSNVWPNFLDEYDAECTAELSRVVVDPLFRGGGVSAVLTRAAIAASSELSIKRLVLECVPTHVPMYHKHGFNPMPKHHCRARDLDQFAVGMDLALGELAADSEAIATMKRDVAMLRRGLNASDVLFLKRALCLCNLKECWKRGVYSNQGTDACPLSQPSHAIDSHSL